jgi:endoglucanase
MMDISRKIKTSPQLAFTLSLFWILASALPCFGQTADYWAFMDTTQLIKVEAASESVLMLLFRGEGEPYPSSEPADYSINSENPASIGRSMSPLRIDILQMKDTTGRWLPVEDRYQPIMLQHRIYLFLEDTLANGQLYNIHTPFGDTSFTFQSLDMVSESIKVNQVGMHPSARNRMAFFAAWAGDSGSLSTQTERFELIQESTGNIIFEGNLSTPIYDANVGGDYYSLDFSEAGITDSLSEYHIHIPGIGRSHSFGIGNAYPYHIYYTMMKGWYHQRCGIALESPYTQWTRDICHQNMTIMESELGMMTVSNPQHVPSEGGHHDAGDFDHRPVHMINPGFLMHAYEMNPNLFPDNQLNLPESGNGISDLLDEALWALKRWEILQEENGGVRAGMETSGHPPFGQVYAANDDYEYGTYRIHGMTTLAGAGAFAYAARLLQQQSPARSAELEERALRAWNFYEENKDSALYANEWGGSPLLCYAGLQLYLLTEEDAYHQVFLEHIDEALRVYNQEWFNMNTFIEGSRSFTHYFISYVLDDSVPKDSLVQQQIQTRIIQWADEVLSSIEGNGLAYFNHSAWGMGSALGRQGDYLMHAYRFTNDSRYLNGAGRLMDYMMGANQLGRCFVTGLGEAPPYDPCHADSYQTTSRGLGPVPGISLYIFGDPGNYGNISTNFIYPPPSETPAGRQFWDGWLFIRNNEFTTWETMGPNTLFAALLLGADSTAQVQQGALRPFGNPDYFPGGYRQNLNHTVENTWVEQEMDPGTVFNAIQTPLSSKHLYFENGYLAWDLNPKDPQGNLQINFLEIFNSQGKTIYSLRVPSRGVYKLNKKPGLFVRIRQNKGYVGIR